MSKLIQEAEMYRRKLARAKRIARAIRKRKIDTYLRDRVYIIIMSGFSLISLLIFMIFLLISGIGGKNEFIDSQEKTFEYMERVLLDCSEDSLFKTNIELVHVIDSLQVMIFAYNRRFQFDQKTIQDLTLKNDKSNRVYYKKEEEDTLGYLIKYEDYEDEIGDSIFYSYDKKDTTEEIKLEDSLK